MSEKRIGFSRLVSAALNWCKKVHERLADCLASSGQRRDQLNVAQSSNIGRPLEVDFYGERIELRKLTKLLSIGDRVRILCDDGVLVAEKISHTQFKVIQCQASVELVH